MTKNKNSDVGSLEDPTLGEIRDKLKVGSELIINHRVWGPSFRRVVSVEDRGVVMDIIMNDWKRNLGHRSLYEWHWRMKLR